MDTGKKSRQLHGGLAGAAAAAVALLGSAPALAYNEYIHEIFPKYAFASTPDFLDAKVAPATPADLDAFRVFFYRAAAALPDARLRDAFLKVYPAEDKFDAWEWKQLCMLNPARPVWGFDRAPDAGEASAQASRRDLLMQASRWPDDDKRNQERFHYDAARQPEMAGADPKPYDPAILDMGNIRGTSSQAHAHYGLLPGPFSDDSEVLKTDPRHFASPPTTKTFAAEFAQLYTDLALIAALSDVPNKEWIARAHEGAFMHHAADVANQIHTVQVGLYDFFMDAFFQQLGEEVLSLGGLLRSRPSLRTIGIRFIGNHHFLIEDLFAKRLREGIADPAKMSAEAKTALDAIGTDDTAFRATLEAALSAAGAAPSETEFGRIITQQIIEASSYEAPELYRLARTIAAKDMREWRGREYKDGFSDPDQHLRRDTSAPDFVEAQRKFYELQRNAFARVGTAFRLWEELYRDASAASDDGVRKSRAAAITARMVERLLRYHEEAAARLASWTPAPAQIENVNWVVPGVVAVLVGLAAGGVYLAVPKKPAGSP